MEITINFIEKNFVRFNKEYFHNELDMPRFEIMHTRKLLGQCKWDNSHGKRINYRIRITDYFDFDEKKYQNILLHEMIHLFIRQKDIKDTRRHHGQVFYDYARLINEFGWNISRTDSIEGIDLASDEVKTYHLITFKDSKGKFFLMAYNPKYRAYFERLFNRHANYYTNVLWFTSTDSKKYASLTLCRSSIRGRFISEKVYNEIADMFEIRLVV